MGRSNSPHTLSDGVTWEVLQPWEPNYISPCLLALPNGGMLLLISQQTTGSMGGYFHRGRVKNADGSWGEWTDISDVQGGAITAALHNGEIWIAFTGWASPRLCHYGRLPINGDVIGTWDEHTVEWDTSLPRLVSHADSEQLLIVGGWNETAFIFCIDDEEMTTLDISGTDNWGNDAPRSVPSGNIVPVVFSHDVNYISSSEGEGNGQLGAIEWSPE